MTWLEMSIRLVTSGLEAPVGQIALTHDCCKDEVASILDLRVLAPISYLCTGFHLPRVFNSVQTWTPQYRSTISLMPTALCYWTTCGGSYTTQKEISSKALQLSGPAMAEWDPTFVWSATSPQASTFYSCIMELTHFSLNFVCCLLDFVYLLVSYLT